ncbi:TetR family transcriptional regulator [Pseudomonas fluorescens]|nr:TetR family transcriptional regulator [Pseudomonas fluorescens]
MVGKTKADAQLTCDGILDAAEEVFRDKGVARTSIHDIAQRAGCTRGAVYWHFKNKVDVLMATYDRATLPLYDGLQELLETPQIDPFGAWHDHLIGSLRRFEQDRRQQNTCDILTNRCEVSEELKPLELLEMQRHRCFISSTENLLGQARDIGQMAGTIDIPLVAMCIHATVHGLIRTWLRQPGEFALANTVAAYVDVLMRGLAVPEPGSAGTQGVRMTADRATP